MTGINNACEAFNYTTNLVPPPTSDLTPFKLIKQKSLNATAQFKGFVPGGHFCKLSQSNPVINLGKELEEPNAADKILNFFCLHNDDDFNPHEQKLFALQYGVLVRHKDKIGKIFNDLTICKEDKDTLRKRIITLVMTTRALQCSSKANPVYRYWDTISNIALDRLLGNHKNLGQYIKNSKINPSINNSDIKVLPEIAKETFYQSKLLHFYTETSDLILPDEKNLPVESIITHFTQNYDEFILRLNELKGAELKDPELKDLELKELKFKKFINTTLIKTLIKELETFPTKYSSVEEKFKKLKSKYKSVLDVRCRNHKVAFWEIIISTGIIVIDKNDDGVGKISEKKLGDICTIRKFFDVLEYKLIQNQITALETTNQKLSNDFAQQKPDQAEQIRDHLMDKLKLKNQLNTLISNGLSFELSNWIHLNYDQKIEVIEDIKCKYKDCLDSSNNQLKSLLTLLLKKINHEFTSEVQNINELIRILEGDCN